MKMRKLLSVSLALAMVLGCMAFAGCGGSKSEAGSMTLNVGAYPDTVDPALNSAVDGATYIVHTFAGLVGFQQDETGKLVLTPECATELPAPVKMDDGKTSYTFKLRDGLKWSDGTALDANAFVYAWNRAADPASLHRSISSRPVMPGIRTSVNTTSGRVVRIASRAA